MGEYGREQRSQLSRAIANSETGNRQLKGIIDNRSYFHPFNIVGSRKVFQAAWDWVNSGVNGSGLKFYKPNRIPPNFNYSQCGNEVLHISESYDSHDNRTLNQDHVTIMQGIRFRCFRSGVINSDASANNLNPGAVAVEALKDFDEEKTPKPSPIIGVEKSSAKPKIGFTFSEPK